MGGLVVYGGSLVGGSVVYGGSFVYGGSLVYGGSVEGGGFVWSTLMSPIGSILVSTYIHGKKHESLQMLNKIIVELTNCICC